jgi:predicted RNA-binding Zn ribbon-like protein
MKKKQTGNDDWALLGGRVCLDFANTIENRNSSSARMDTLKSCEDFFRWCNRAGVLSAGQAQFLLGAARTGEADDRQTLENALELREMIYRVFQALTLGREPAERDMREFNAFHARAMAASTVVRAGGEYAVAFGPVAGSLDWPLNPIVWSAVLLLTSEDLHRIKLCSNEQCGWLFIDESKNGSRRWCDMSSCGNRAKARRHYHRASKQIDTIRGAVVRRPERPTRGRGARTMFEYGIRPRRSEPEMEIGSDD